MRLRPSDVSPGARAERPPKPSWRARRLGVRALRVVGRLAPVAISALNGAAAHARHRGDYVIAATLYRLGVAALGKTPRARSVDRRRAQSLGSLATVLRIQGQYGRAERLFRRALAVAREAFGPDDVGLVAILNDQAV